MRTFFTLYAFLQIASIAWWVYYLLISKPKFNNGANRFMKNYNEGGQYVLLSTVVWSVILSIVASLIVLLFNFLER